jgi:hypothetical protein
LSPLYRRSVCDAIGPWSTGRILEDWDYECRAGLLGVLLHYCPEPVGLDVDGGDTHAGLAWQYDVRAMHDRIEAFIRIVGYAQQAKVDNKSPEMQHLVRSVFWMAREAGAWGMAAQAQALFDLARAHADRPGLDYRLIGAAVRLLGWQRTARLASWLDRLRRSRDHA